MPESRGSGVPIAGTAIFVMARRVSLHTERRRTALAPARPGRGAIAHALALLVVSDPPATSGLEPEDVAPLPCAFANRSGVDEMLWRPRPWGFTSAHRGEPPHAGTISAGRRKRMGCMFGVLART